mmetsp:Transcript_5366/g.10365  ORF Transcript_5366/g.10365 Transcript_5366/m.10365 type:complete len:84 (+) Transcript_5366:3139-3390(+)
MLVSDDICLQVSVVSDTDSEDSTRDPSLEKGSIIESLSVKELGFCFICGSTLPVTPLVNEGWVQTLQTLIRKGLIRRLQSRVS